MIKIVVGLLIGGAIGAFIGWKGRCATGACPLTSNPLAGGLYGALLGSMFAGLWACSPTETSPPAAAAPSAAETTPDSAPAKSPIVVVESAEAFDRLIAEARLPVLVDFWATWCPPCVTQGKILTDMAGEVADRLVIAKVDIDQVPDLSDRYAIRSIPTLMLFEDGDRKKTFVGLRTKEQLLRESGL